ncbi:MAG: hypothetical protein HOF69_00875 [Campylobacteraceae bacterium]|nr:hypothetical protein [Campylobacteraceae bacterium]MBT3881795.1 hypothetical protein [Campylobacteraceae bacterium]MBT4030562.1 hypothetical protein [Campylobacteraceae bacterium]MBT4179846.1 hypothetical protein [Campylobacteraceae bacterium]MBT4572439.1 hypothetical protein [Campylobacteraceae bacterium]
MALESVVGSVNQNYIAQQKNESSISKKENTQDIMPQEVIEDIDYSNMDKGAFGSEVKELLEQFNNGTLTTENLQAKMNELKSEYMDANTFAYQNNVDFSKTTGSFAQAQANISQASVAKLLS